MKAGSEAAFQQQVLNLAELYGWRAYHTHNSRRSQPGFPDLVLIRGAELIFAELKTDKGRLRPEQEAWIAELAVVMRAVTDARAAACVSVHAVELEPHVDVYLWRPADFDELHQRLARGRHQLPALYRDQAA